MVKEFGGGVDARTEIATSRCPLQRMFNRGHGNSYSRDDVSRVLHGAVSPCLVEHVGVAPVVTFVQTLLEIIARG
jgi:hypothetical protein